MPEESKRLILIDPHSTGKFRGLIPAVTNGSFKKEFMELSKKKDMAVRHGNVNLW